MTDSRTDKLRAAILRDVLLFAPDGSMAVQLASGIYRVGLPERPRRAMDIGHQLADAIVAAIAPVLDEGVTIEWAYRYPNGHVATWIPALMTEDVVRGAVAEHPDLLTVVRRRVSPWEDAE